MKFVTYEKDKREFAGVLDKDGKKVMNLVEITGKESFDTILEFINTATNEDFETIKKVVEGRLTGGMELGSVKLLAPITRPIHDIICMGVNYSDHLAESQKAIKDGNLDNVSQPVYFSKRASRIIGPDEDIRGEFQLDDYLDYEVELAVIIGKRGRDIPKDQVEDHIFGYSVFNDLSSRRLQRSHIQWYKGKSLDGYSVMGPVILHKSQLPFPLEVDVISRVNGEQRQKSNTRMLINNIETLVSDFSKGITLEPGDIIATGTPAGVGMGFSPPKYLKKGDVVECEIPQIGSLGNRIV